MSRYKDLWIYIDLIFKRYNKEKIELSFNQIKDATGFDIDNSFLTYKKELLDYGYKVEKIKLKDKIIIFLKID